MRKGKIIVKVCTVQDKRMEKKLDKVFGHYNISAWQKFPKFQNNDRPKLTTFSSRTNLDT